MSNPYESETGLYERVRPDYPDPVSEQILVSAQELISAQDRAPIIADVGAGTGKMTLRLADLGAEIEAIEPSTKMSTQLQTNNQKDRIRIWHTCAENTGLPANSCDGAVFAQSWHWCDHGLASLELHRILRSGATVHVIYNQLDVSIPWVKRLSRIMRSGDVHRPGSVPLLGDRFTVPVRTDYYWRQQLSTDEILALARTRSSYLNASDTVRRRMQSNLRWYLHQHLGLGVDSNVFLPYLTYHWQARIIGV